MRAPGLDRPAFAFWSLDEEHVDPRRQGDRLEQRGPKLAAAASVSVAGDDLDRIVAVIACADHRAPP